MLPSPRARKFWYKIENFGTKHFYFSKSKTLIFYGQNCFNFFCLVILKNIWGVTPGALRNIDKKIDSAKIVCQNCWEYDSLIPDILNTSQLNFCTNIKFFSAVVWYPINNGCDNHILIVYISKNRLYQSLL